MLFQRHQIEWHHKALKAEVTYEGQESGVEEDIGSVDVHSVDEMHQVAAIIRRDLRTYNNNCYACYTIHHVKHPNHNICTQCTKQLEELTDYQHSKTEMTASISENKSKHTKGSFLTFCVF